MSNPLCSVLKYLPCCYMGSQMKTDVKAFIRRTLRFFFFLPIFFLFSISAVLTQYPHASPPPQNPTFRIPFCAPYRRVGAKCFSIWIGPNWLKNRLVSYNSGLSSAFILKWLFDTIYNTIEDSYLFYIAYKLWGTGWVIMKLIKEKKL
jgi:hypothetical protein